MLIDARPPSRNRTLDIILTSDPSIRKRVRCAFDEENNGIVAYFPLIGNLHSGKSKEYILSEAADYLKNCVQGLSESDIHSAVSNVEIMSRECFMAKYSRISAREQAYTNTLPQTIIPPKEEYHSDLPAYRPRRRRRRSRIAGQFPPQTVKLTAEEQAEEERIAARAPKIVIGEDPKNLEEFNERMAREYDLKLRAKYGPLDARPTASRRTDIITPEEDQGAIFYDRNKPCIYEQTLSQGRPSASRPGGSDRRRGGHHNPKRRRIIF
jgi:hypothetical protein